MKTLNIIFFIFALVSSSGLCFASGTRFTPEEKTSLFRTAEENTKLLSKDGSDDFQIKEVKNILDENLNQLLKLGAISKAELARFNAVFEKKYKGVQQTNKKDIASFLKIEFDKINSDPIAQLHESCMSNYLCRGNATCTVVNADHTGIGSCISEKSKQQCASDIECCSNKCSNKKCVLNRMCLKCSTTKISKEAPECCPGLQNVNGTCDPGLYFVPPEINVPKEYLGYDTYLIILENETRRRNKAFKRRA